MKLLTKKEVLETFTCTKKELKEWVKEGLPYLQIGQYIRFAESHLNEWLKEQERKQKELEASFVDAKGRTIDAYCATEEILAFFQIPKETLKQEMDYGMPYEKIGRRNFFQCDDLIIYFTREKKTIDKNETKETKETKKTPAVFVIDGSYSVQTSEYGAGVVMKQEEEVESFYFGGKVPTTKTNVSEYFAILHTLELIQEKELSKAVIYTDQVDFLQLMKKSSVPMKEWFKEESIKPFMERLVRLLEETKPYVTFHYVGKLPNEHKNELYQKAHVLSRYYRTKKVEGLNAPTLPSSITTTTTEPKETVEIVYEATGKNYTSFLRKGLGKIKKTKVMSINPIHAAVTVAKTFAVHYPNQLNIVVKGIPNPDKHLQDIFHSNKAKVPKFVFEGLEFIQEHADFSMEGDYQKYLTSYQNQKENDYTSIA